jgi:hypothetical protein
MPRGSNQSRAPVKNKNTYREIRDVAAIVEKKGENKNAIYSILIDRAVGVERSLVA